MYYDIILLGIIIGLIYTELTGFSPAGTVTAGYIAIYLKTPERIAVTVGVALAAYVINKLLGKIVILYGRRSFAFMIFTSCLLSAGVSRFGLLGSSISAVGFMIPGIMARDFERSGIFKSLFSLAIVTGITALVLVLLGHPVFAARGYAG